MRYKITNERTGQLVSADVNLANNPFSRMKGLLGRGSLRSGEAIILKPASSIHTAFMRFSIDVVFLNRDDEVVHLKPDLAPFRLGAAVGARSVIEMPAGRLSEIDLQVGDRLEIGPTG